MTNEQIKQINEGDFIKCETYCSIGDRLIFFKKDFKVLTNHNNSNKVDLECVDTGVIYKNIDLSYSKGCVINILK